MCIAVSEVIYPVITNHLLLLFDAYLEGQLHE
jgi:hypothetical protein